MLRNKSLGYVIAGFVSEKGGNIGQKLAGNIPVVGVLRDIRGLAAEHDARDVVIALSNNQQSELVQVVKSCELFIETIKVVPSLGSVFAYGVQVDELGDFLALSVPRNLVKPWNALLKKGFEFGLSLALLLLLAPLFLIIVVILKADSRGPIFFSQKRLGLRRRPFKIFKFRSMHSNHEARLKAHFRTHPEAEKEWETYRKLRGYDPRVSRVGKWLRKWSLDELPQLVNVLKGDMSLVGPRPYLSEELDGIGLVPDIIFQVKPGLTGLWQVRGRNILSFEERLAIDEFYIRNWSFWLDVIILFQTLKALVRREGAF
ncbi:MAG: exopolysaccharide biosynthesis polyprenyl glycosylphosphotransferase [Candidatus Aminicenantes bacterium]|nr:exopolysaccharide biosynthesis polyprenyl glycosylphosphotransferase [Candidatus Aminicenantes bacterium]